MSAIVLAGGCFWGLQRFLDQFPGVLATEAGYANGPGDTVSYEAVCRGSGHAEAVRVQYDPATLPLPDLIGRFFVAIDPLALNRQGNDCGIQYRTGAYYTEQGQVPELREAFAKEERRLGQPLAVELQALTCFCRAEDYHQKYLEKHPDGYCHLPPRLLRLGAGVPLEGEAQLRARIGDLAYAVTQERATERPFSGALVQNEAPGLYVDVVSGEPLFSSEDKYDSGCGWPAFTRPVDEEALLSRADHSHGMERVEVLSARARSHLGHVFTDGPKASGGLRYCINSAALRFIPRERLGELGYGEWLPLFSKE